MGSKRRLHHLLVELRYIKNRYFVIALLITGLTFVLAFRQNNITAINLRDSLLQVDQKNGDVETALRDLREYTYSHMNADLDTGPGGIYPPIQLKYRYQRLVEADKARVDTANTKLYTEAQNYCEQQITSRKTIERIPCIQDYLARHQGAKMAAIPDALYKFDFEAPVWSPDLAGWSLAATIILLVVFFIRLCAEWWLRYQLRD
jgi:hypothetical protein